MAIGTTIKIASSVVALVGTIGGGVLYMENSYIKEPRVKRVEVQVQRVATGYQSEILELKIEQVKDELNEIYVRQQIDKEFPTDNRRKEFLEKTLDRLEKQLQLLRQVQ